MIIQTKKVYGTIFIVDDQLENLQLLTQILSERGYKVRAAKTGHEAIASIKSEIPDLVLLDIRLPDIDGFEVCTSLKADEITMDVPVIFLSALDEIADKIRGFSVGGIDYITKPFRSEEVIIRVQTHLKTNRMRMELIQKSIELLEKESQYRTLANSGMALIWTSGTDKLCNYFNEPWINFTGRSMEQELGNGWAEGVHPDDFDRCLETYVTSFDKREPFTMEYRLRHVSGEYKWLLDMGSPNFNLNGDFTGFIGHCFDISSLKNVEAEVKLKNEELQKLNNEKDKFYSIIAHDLRNPLSGFLGLTQIIAEDLPNLTMLQVQDFAVSMRTSASNLYRLLNNLLEWSQIQKGSITFTPGAFKLRPLVDESIAMLTESAKTKVMEILIEIPDELDVFADKDMLQTIIRNLVSNAIKFTNKGGKVRISTTLNSDNSIEVSVKDTGIGMNPEILSSLFTLDVQSTRKGTEGELSTGLGLLLCKEFVEKHGGKIWVESDSEGKSGTNGSVFNFTLPGKKLEN